MSSDYMTDTIRVRIEPEKKTLLTKLYEEKGTNLSQAIRDFLDKETESQSDPLDRFNAIMASADKKREAYGAPEPTVQDIVDYVDKVRESRQDTMAVSK